MLREEITRALKQAEHELPVEAMRWHGFQVWPALRLHWAFRLHGDTQVAAPVGGKLNKKLVRWLGRGKDAAERVALSRRADTIFIGPANRIQGVLGRAVHPLAEPLREAYKSAGLTLAIWTLGPGRTMFRRGVRNIDHSLGAQMQQRVERSAKTPEPDWHVAARCWASRVLGFLVSWKQTEEHLLRIEASADFFERELRAAGARAVVLDCWYGFRQQGALLAAHRLGLCTADLQHGLQGEGHFAYSGWGTAKGVQYETWPKRFWVWGQDDAQALVKNNTPRIHTATTQVVGNLWLNAWRGDGRTFAAAAEAARDALGASAGTTTVLVTLQKGIAYAELLQACLRKSPRHVRWLIRLHRQMSDDPTALEQRLRRSGAAVDVVNASRLPLYALFGVATCHVTGFSTCAIEALAFGVPTLLTHESGRAAFGRFIEAGVMQMATSADELVAGVAQPLASPEACRAAAEAVFSASAMPLAAMRELLG